MKVVPNCTQSFKNKRSLTAHNRSCKAGSQRNMKNVSSSEYSTCELCENTFKAKTSYYRHKKVCGQEDVLKTARQPIQISMTGVTWYCCLLCSANCLSQVGLDHHIIGMHPTARAHPMPPLPSLRFLAPPIWGLLFLPDYYKPESSPFSG